MQTTELISQALMKGRAAEVKQLVEKGVGREYPGRKNPERGLLSGMSIIGDKFKKNEVYVPEVLIAARAMKAGMKC